MIVLDCSIAIAFLFQDEPPAEHLLDRVTREGAIVPALFLLEVMNVLLTAERRNRIAPPDTERAMTALLSLPLEIAEPPLEAVLARARAHALTSYDAAYMALAMHLQVPLATRDKALISAARKESLAVIQS